MSLLPVLLWHSPSLFFDRWIIVKFYSHLYKIRQQLAPDMEAHVMLTRCGGLDVRQVMNLWGLEDCVPIDPMRWTPAPRTDVNMLSPLAVRVLTENSGCIMFVEPTISKSTAQKRAFREAIRLTLESVTTMADTTSASVSDLLKEYTPMHRLTKSARKAWSKSKLSRQRFLKRYEAEMLMTQMFACMFLMIFIIYMIHTTLGRVRFEPRQRAWNWARTGSFVL
ncbi:hypothetical protein Moror_3049 [Moniliophthora roreri MCA 2997]|uniref:Uncharacterized protein n=1 Tax=Moniliophthora roreri (strain MCA 2997) TaxID=1381753 RepID=V2X7A6_MONRO|nr:hypothetical protein Moror_3049 [Moniliophthora roreri MCA 2997]